MKTSSRRFALFICSRFFGVLHKVKLVKAGTDKLPRATVFQHGLRGSFGPLRQKGLDLKRDLYVRIQLFDKIESVILLFIVSVASML